MSNNKKLMEENISKSTHNISNKMANLLNFLKTNPNAKIKYVPMRQDIGREIINNLIEHNKALNDSNP